MNRKNKRKFLCHKCGEIGHFRRDCPEKKEKECASFCESSAKKIRNEEESFNFTPEFALHVSNGREVDTKWLLDSGCSKHMTGVIGDLVNYRKFDEKDTEESKYAELADGSLVKAEGQGELHVYLEENGKNVPVLFREVLYIPKIKKRLISVGQLTGKGAEVVFRKRSVLLRISGRSFTFGEQRGKLYKMNGIVASCNFVSVVEEKSKEIELRSLEAEVVEEECGAEISMEESESTVKEKIEFEENANETEGNRKENDEYHYPTQFSVVL